MTDIEDHLQLLVHDARAIVEQMEHEHAMTAAAAHYHLYRVARRFLTAAPAFPAQPADHAGSNRRRPR